MYDILVKMEKKKLSNFARILSRKEGKELVKSFKEGRRLSRLRAKRIKLDLEN